VRDAGAPSGHRCVSHESCNPVRMRCWFLGVISLIGCTPTAVVPLVTSTPPPATTVVPATTNVPAPPPARPLALPPPARKAITAQARAQARAAFAQAIELWSNGRANEANALVESGLKAIDRELPKDATVEHLGNLLESAAFSDNGAAYAVGDTETLLVADAAAGKILGLRVHDFSYGLMGPTVSPKASVVVAPSASDLLVYETKGLTLRLRIAARKDAPMAFITDDQLVTVRLGAAGSAAPASREQLLQRNLRTANMPRSPSGFALPPPPEPDTDDDMSDDEIIVVDLHSGKTDKVLGLVAPPDQGLLRKVASLPPSRSCNDNDECRSYEFNPAPIGRRVEQLRIAAGMVVAGWQGGATTFHRLRDGKLVGAFRSRGERWKPGLVAIWPNPPRAAVVTSLPNVGRGSEPPFSVTALVELNRGRVLELIDECRWATDLAFSRDGTRLMVGDLRRACLHDARTGRHLETTEEVRPSHGSDDDLQDVSVRPAPAGRWLVTAADGAFGIFDERSGKALLRGRNDAGQALVASDDRSLYVADFSGGEAQLITFGTTGVERRLLRMDELEQKSYPPEGANSKEGKRAAILQKMMRSSCVVEGFRLPGELCRMQATP
jgi:hypothetical protein